jgi:hypothetical protein
MVSGILLFAASDMITALITLFMFQYGQNKDGKKKR